MAIQDRIDDAIDYLKNALTLFEKHAEGVEVRDGTSAYEHRRVELIVMSNEAYDDIKDAIDSAQRTLNDLYEQKLDEQIENLKSEIEDLTSQSNEEAE